MARDYRAVRRSTDVPRTAITRKGLSETWRLFAYLRPYRGRFLAAWICLVVSSLGGLAMPYFGGRLIDSAQQRFQEGGSASGASSLDKIALALAGVLILRAACTYCQTVWGAEVGERTMVDLRRDTFGRLIQLPIEFFAHRRVGELTSRVAADLSQI